jgi:peptidoglycan L-alanyl-D-glutamate endopeptidase CwlK
VDGKADWNTPHWNKIAEIGKSLGWSWGGDWTSFKDKPHFEKNFGNTLAELRSKSKGADGYVQLAYLGNEGPRPSFFYAEAA